MFKIYERRFSLIYLAPMLMLALNACESRPQLSPVEKAQQNLMNVRAQAAQDVQAAEKRLSDVIMDTQDKVTQAKATLNQSTEQSRSEGTISGSTSADDGAVKASPRGH